jgi:hypothetical protein
MWIEKADPCKNVQGTVARVCPVNTGEATIPADREASGAKHQKHNRTKQQNAYEDCEDDAFSG